MNFFGETPQVPDQPEKPVYDPVQALRESLNAEREEVARLSHALADAKENDMLPRKVLGLDRGELLNSLENALHEIAHLQNEAISLNSHIARVMYQAQQAEQDSNKNARKITEQEQYISRLRTLGWAKCFVILLLIVSSNISLHSSRKNSAAIKQPDQRPPGSQKKASETIVYRDEYQAAFRAARELSKMNHPRHDNECDRQEGELFRSFTRHTIKDEFGNPITLDLPIVTYHDATPFQKALVDNVLSACDPSSHYFQIAFYCKHGPHAKSTAKTIPQPKFDTVPPPRIIQEKEKRAPRLLEPG